MAGGNSLRGTILIVVLLVCVGMIFMGLKRLGRSSSAHRGGASSAGRTPPGATTVNESEQPKAARAASPKNPSTGSVAAVTPASKPTPTPSDQLVKSLTELELRSGALTLAQANVWKQSLQQLIQRGGEAVPAIAGFLKRNVDLDFRSISGGDSLGHGSLRLALFDALQKIGGSDAIDVARETLRNTADPLEVAMLARSLEAQAPGQYREEEFKAAREVLTQALSGKLRERGDVSPLFELLQAYGDESVIPDLVRTVPYWHHYATFALAGLPEGVGIPALIQLARDPATSAMGRGDFALLPLAQVALQYPQAATVLVEQVRSNNVPPSAWASVAAALAGTHLQYGRGIFGKPSPTARPTNDDLDKRLALVDQILAANPNPDAAQALQQARAMLTAMIAKAR